MATTGSKPPPRIHAFRLLAEFAFCCVISLPSLPDEAGSLVELHLNYHPESKKLVVAKENLRQPYRAAGTSRMPSWINPSSAVNLTVTIRPTRSISPSAMAWRSRCDVPAAFQLKRSS